MKKNLYELIATQKINSKEDYDLFIQNATSIESDEMGKDARIKLNNEMFVEIYAADEDETEMDEYYTQIIRFYTTDEDATWNESIKSKIIEDLKESLIDEITEEVENETERLLEYLLNINTDGCNTKYDIYINKESGEIYEHEGTGRPAGSNLIHIIKIGDNLASFYDDGGFEEYLKAIGVEFDPEMHYRELKELHLKEWEFYKESAINDIIFDVRESSSDYANIRNKVKEIFN